MTGLTLSRPRAALAVTLAAAVAAAEEAVVRCVPALLVAASAVAAGSGPAAPSATTAPASTPVTRARMELKATDPPKDRLPHRTARGGRCDYSGNRNRG